MRKNRRTSRFKACAIATVAAAASSLAFTGSALAQTFNVTNEATLEAALASANAAGGTNTINMAVGLYNPTATLGIKPGTLTLQGPAPVVTVQGLPVHFTGGALVTPAPGASIFSVDAGATLNFNNIDVTAAGSAGNGVIDDNGVTNLNQSTITGQGPGLAVESGATGTLNNSTISDGLDFGIIDDGTLTLNNSTIARNANGGIDNVNGVLSLNNSIISKNGAPNCTGPADTSDHSLDSGTSCGVGALSSTDPLLAAINIKGGTTPVDIPGLGSPAIKAGDPAKCPSVDERNAASPSVAGQPCDLGAVETYYGVAPVLTNGPVHVASASASGTVATFTPTWTAGSPVTGVSCAPASGSTFVPGQTTVTCSGTDSFFGTAGTGTFVVTDTQSTPPVVTTSGDETVAAADATGAVATFTASATDAVDGTDPVTCTPASGSKFPLGPTTVTCTATDSGGLTGSANLVVTVADQTPPVITVPSGISAVGAGSLVTYSPAPSATDNVDGTDPVSCSPASGSAFPAGNTTVTCTSTDAAHNTATKTFVVTITTTIPDHTNATVQGEVPNGGAPGGLQITAATCEFGPVFIPGLAKTYGCTAAVTVTSTDSTTLLTVNDVSTAASVGHLVNPVPVAHALANAVQDQATSAVATGPTFTALTGTAAPLLNYTAPVTSDPVTLAFQQAISGTEPLYNGTYGATVLLQLSGTP
jgi:hypothetical protein